MSTINEISGSIRNDNITINNNFNNLNTDKLEFGDLKTINGNSIVGSGDLVVGGDVSNLVPYTGATQDVDLDTFKLNAQSIHAKGTAGNGYLGLKHQSANITASANESSLGANSAGNPVWKNDGNPIQEIMLQGDEAAIVATINGKISAGSNVSITGSGSTASPYIINSSASGGSGDVVGPASSTNQNIAVFSGSTGKIIEDGGIGKDELVTLTNTVALTNKTISGATNTLTDIPQSAVTNLTTNLANKKTDSMATSRILGRTTAGTGVIEELTNTQVKTLLAIANTDVSGLGTLATQNGTFSGNSSGTNTGDVTLAGTPNYITIAGQVITRALIDLTSHVTGILPSTQGGTGNGFTKFSGPTTAEKIFTLPDASSTIVVQGGELGTPTSGTLTNATGLPIAGLVPSTSTALGVGSIELGHASDTTLSRVSAGVVAIEGNNIITKNTNIQTIAIAISDETTAITTGTAKVTFRMPYAFTLTAVRASLTTVSSSGTPTFDINENGTTILSTKLTIDANEKTSTTAVTAAVISDSSLADDAEITIDIDTAGTGATGAKIYLIGYKS